MRSVTRNWFSALRLDAAMHGHLRVYVSVNRKSNRVCHNRLDPIFECVALVRKVTASIEIQLYESTRGLEGGDLWSDCCCSILVNLRGKAT